MLFLCLKARAAFSSSSSCQENIIKFQFLRQMALLLTHAVLVPESEGRVLIQQLLSREYN
jgi:hypothetical protein